MQAEHGGYHQAVAKLVHCASAGGAEVLGFEGVGTLEVGQAADLAV